MIRTPALLFLWPALVSTPGLEAQVRPERTPEYLAARMRADRMLPHDAKLA